MPAADFTSIGIVRFVLRQSALPELYAPPRTILLSPAVGPVGLVSIAEA